MRRHELFVFGLLALAAMFATAAGVSADDKKDPPPKDTPVELEQRIQIVTSAGGKYWIGVHAVPAEAALKAHLGIEHGLLVRHVIDESPAKKAGLQEHDVLLKYGDTSIKSVEHLVQAVGETKDNETTVLLIRGGKEKTVKVTAEERPENLHAIHVDATDVGELHGVIGDWIHKFHAGDKDGSPLKFRVIGPGFVEGGTDAAAVHKALIGAQGKLPKNLSIQVNVTGEKPAQIKVTRDDKTWEVTADNLDELPEDIRPHVKRMLGGHAAVAIGFGSDGGKLWLKELDVNPGNVVVPNVKLPKLPDLDIPKLKESSAAASRAIRIISKSAGDEVDLQKLREDVKALQAEVKKLKAATKSNPKPKPKKNDD